MFDRIELEEMTRGPEPWASENQDLGIYAWTTDEPVNGHEEQEVLEILTAHGY